MFRRNEPGSFDGELLLNPSVVSNRSTICPVHGPRASYIAKNNLAPLRESSSNIVEESQRKNIGGIYLMPWKKR